MLALQPAIWFTPSLDTLEAPPLPIASDLGWNDDDDDLAGAASRRGYRGCRSLRIGMRINRWWKVWKWFPIFLEMPRMLREQDVDPSIGQLSSRLMFGLRNIGVLQHWRSAEHLHAYAHGAGHLHLAAWQRFNARIGTSGDVGIWHETYVVPARNVESIFVNMPRYGLGIAGEVFAAKGDRASAKKRLRRVVVGQQAASAITSGGEPIS